MTQPPKQLKYHYLDHSFDNKLQRSYDRAHQYSPPSVHSPDAKSPHHSSEFSPYQNKQPHLRQKILIQELKSQNHMLADQISEYKLIIDKLHIQLRGRDEQILRVKSVYEGQQNRLELKLRQMHEEINALLTKNKYLEEKTIATEKQFQREKIEQRSRSISMNANNQKSKFLQELTAVLSCKEKLNKNYSFSQNPSPKKSSSRSEEELLEEVGNLMRKQVKYRELLESIGQMFTKITGKNMDSGELKQVWKWLKELGHNYNMIQKWKKMLCELLGLREQMGIDEVLQKTVIALHQK